MGVLRTKGGFDFVGSGAVSGYNSTGTWNRIANYLESASGSLSSVSFPGERHSGVEATFVVGDKTGIFCAAQSLTDGIFAKIDYIGDETRISLYAAPEYTTAPITANGAIYAEIPMPKQYMTRGAETTLRLMPSKNGWFLSVKIGSSFKRIMALAYIVYAGANSHLTSKKSNVATEAGFFCEAAGSKLRKISVYAIGSKYAPLGESATTVYKHQFGGSGSFNASSGATTTDPQGIFLPVNYVWADLQQASGYLSVASPSPSLIMTAAVEGIAFADQPMTIVKLEDYRGGGQLVIKVNYGGTTRNIYINSDIGGTGIKAITVETGGP
jgi:hypothetical protein